MIQITPAILTDKIEFFELELEKLNDFYSCDIDLIKPPYVNNRSVGLVEVLPILLKSRISSIGFHLMEFQPMEDVHLILNSKLNFVRIYLQQETEISEFIELTLPTEYTKGVSIEINSSLKSIEFYNRFKEVQFMSIEIGKQGNTFQDKVFEKIKKLREMGYLGRISIDGSVNLDTAIEIRKNKIDRVSVGSYFSRSENIKRSFELLDQALNS